MPEAPLPTWSSVIAGYLRGRGWSAFLFFFHFALKGLPAWLFPLYIGSLVALAERRDPEWHWKLGLWSTLISLALLWNIPGHTLCQRALSRVVRGRGHQLRLSVCRQLQQLSLLFHGRESSGRMHTKIVRDIDTIENSANQIAHTVCNALFVLITTTTITLLTVPWASLVFLVLTPAAVAVNATFRRRLQSRAADYRLSAERLSARVQDMLVMMPVTRAHGLEEVELRDAEGRIGDVRDNASRFDVISAVFGSTSWSSFMLFQVLFMIVMVVFVMRGIAKVGDMVVFQGLFGQLTGSILGVVGSIPMFVQIREAHRSIDEILGAPDLEENRHGRAPAHVNGAIELRAAAYTYPGSPTPAIAPTDLVISPGESVAIVGPSGGGKSTLVSLMLGLLRPTEARSFSTVKTCELDMRPTADASASSRSRASSSPAPSPTTSPTGRPRRATTTSDTPSSSPTRGALSPNCPTASTPASAPADARSRAVSSNASPSPARSCETRACSCSTSRPAPSTPRPSSPSARRSPTSCPGGRSSSSRTRSSTRGPWDASWCSRAVASSPTARTATSSRATTSTPAPSPALASDPNPSHPYSPERKRRVFDMKRAEVPSLTLRASRAHALDLLHTCGGSTSPAALRPTRPPAAPRSPGSPLAPPSPS
ncbi:MAG: ABC transporter transmembrane domain-containing protein [Phycisphaerales bacterium]